MDKIIKGYNEFIKKNEEFIYDEDSTTLDNKEETIQEEPITDGDSDESEGGYIGDRAMIKLSEVLGSELIGNTINYEGSKVEYVAEFDGFLVKGPKGTKKIPVNSASIDEAIDQVVDLIGASVLSEGKKSVKK